MEKILLVGSSTINKMEFAEKLAQIDDTLRIASMFTSDLQYQHLTKDNNTNHVYYNNYENINLDYKNNALFYIVSNELISYGVTLDEFYNTDIVILDTANFNSISDKILNSNKIIIVWIDTKYTSNNKGDFKETKFLMDRIDRYPYLYFMDTDDIEDVCKTVLSYINGNEGEKKLIREENS